MGGCKVVEFDHFRIEAGHDVDKRQNIDGTEQILVSSLKGDESRLRQVVTNLLSNAAKYTEKGSIKLCFNYREKDGQMLLVVAVRDTGIGIKKENMEKLFTQFTRFDVEKNRNIEGTGLGLALAKRLTDLMGGTLEMEADKLGEFLRQKNAYDYQVCVHGVKSSSLIPLSTSTGWQSPRLEKRSGYDPHLFYLIIILCESACKTGSFILA